MRGGGNGLGAPEGLEDGAFEREGGEVICKGGLHAGGRVARAWGEGRGAVHGACPGEGRVYQSNGVAT